MMATWFLLLSALVYFQDTTATLIPVSLQYAPKCEGLRCHQSPQYRIQRSQYVLQPQLLQSIQKQAEYQLPSVEQNPQPKCLYGHSLEPIQVYDSNDQQKLIQGLQSINPQLQYQNQEQKQQQEEYQASYQQLKNTEQEKLQASYQQSNNGYQQKDFESSYQQLNNDFQQKLYQASYQNENKGYLPPQLPQQQSSNDFYQTGYQSSQKESQNSFSSSQINQGLLYNTNVQNNYESSLQNFNNAHLSSLVQHQQQLNANVQQNENIKSELSQEHHGKIKQTVSYDISHQYKGYNEKQGQLNAYNNAQSSTNIEQHHDINDQSEGKDGDSEETDVETDKHKKHHDAYYKFQYAVNDQHTGDIKNHKEERAGDEVRGEYSLLEKDGNVRTVKYFADWKTGFHATVHNSKPRN